MAVNTGFAAGALVVHVLTGQKPLLPRVRETRRYQTFALPNGEHLARRSVTLTFDTADLTFNELRALYNDIRDYLGGKGTEGLTTEDMEFWRLVESLEGPPTKWGKKGKFWEEVRQRWNRDHQDKGYTVYTTVRGTQSKYESLRKRLGISDSP